MTPTLLLILEKKQNSIPNLQPLWCTMAFEQLEKSVIFLLTFFLKTIQNLHTIEERKIKDLGFIFVSEQIF